MVHWCLSLPAPAPAKRTAGGMGTKLWEPAPHSDYRFCQYVSPSVAHDSHHKKGQIIIRDFVEIKLLLGL